MIPSNADAIVALFEGLPNVMFSLKDMQGHYLSVNQAFIDRAARKTAAEVIGRRAMELFAPELAVTYEAQDQELVREGRPVRRQLELINRPNGKLGWYVTNKTLLVDERGCGIAIAGVSVDAEAPLDRPGLPGLEAAVKLARTRFCDRVTVQDLADAAEMQRALLERRMRRYLGVAPRQLLVRVRVEEAVYRITTSDAPLADIAVHCGFFDHAAMTRQVKRLLGVPPGTLRAARRGWVPIETPVSLGRRDLYRRGAIEAFVEPRQEGSR